MLINIGTKIKELRKRDGRTQEDLAQVLGVTAQAVSRWEANGGYPDMEIIPSIANYFGITIDALFGYDCQRDQMVEDILTRVRDTANQEEAILQLREGLLRFPQNEKLSLALAGVLCEAGWNAHQVWSHYDDEGYLRHRRESRENNPAWSESIAICENLVKNTKDTEILYAALDILILLHGNFGEMDKVVYYANRLPSLHRCRELALCSALDGQDGARVLGETLLSMAGTFGTQLVSALVHNLSHCESGLAIEKIKGALALFDLLCDDENYGEFSGNRVELYLYLSRLQWEFGDRDEAFVSLDKAYESASAYEALCDGTVRHYTAPLLREVAFQVTDIPPSLTTAGLPDSWPVWPYPDAGEIKAAMQNDPRWDAWVQRCRGH